MIRILLAALTLLSVATTTEAAVYPPSASSPDRLLLRVHENHPGAAKANGVVNSVDMTQRKVNVSHGSIKQLGWPAMTVDFAVGKDVDLNLVKAGMKIDFTLVKGTGGSWTVDTLKPAVKQ